MIFTEFVYLNLNFKFTNPIMINFRLCFFHFFKFLIFIFRRFIAQYHFIILIQELVSKTLLVN